MRDIGMWTFLWTFIPHSNGWPAEPGWVCRDLPVIHLRKTYFSHFLLGLDQNLCLLHCTMLIVRKSSTKACHGKRKHSLHIPKGYRTLAYLNCPPYAVSGHVGPSQELLLIIPCTKYGEERWTPNKENNGGKVPHPQSGGWIKVSLDMSRCVCTGVCKVGPRGDETGSLELPLEANCILPWLKKETGIRRLIAGKT